jgi:hypothetical protein
MDELELLRAELDQCRRELAVVRAEQETWAEDLHRERRRRTTAEERLRALSRAVDKLLTEGPQAGPTRRSRREERELCAAAERVGASHLFRGPWYVRHYPEAVLTGMSPARHYVETGADQDFDPGPDFSTRRHRDAHPELSPGGLNPLLHALDE